MWNVNEAQRKPTYTVLSTKCSTDDVADHSLSLIQNAHIPKIQRVHTSDDVKTDVHDDNDETQTMISSGEQPTHKIQVIADKANDKNTDTDKAADAETQQGEGEGYTVGTATPGTVASSVFNFSNTAIGVGILAIPYAVAQIGYVLSLIMLVSCAVIAAFSSHIQMLTATVLRPTSSYKTACEATVPVLRYFADFAVMVALYGGVCAYLIAIGQLLPDIVLYFNTNLPAPMYNHRVWITIYLVLFILPCVYCRKLTSLRYVSLFAMFCFLYLLVVVVLFATGVFDAGHTPKGKMRAFPEDAESFFRALPIFLYAYELQANSFGIVNELKNCSKSKINKIISYSMTFVLALYIVMGYGAYSTYGTNLADNLLLVYPTDNVAVLIARIALSFAVTFSYPVIFHPCTHDIASLFFGKPNADALSKTQFVALVTVMWLISFIVAMVTTDLGLTVAISGCIGSTAIIFILPGLFYLLMDDKSITSDPWYKCKKYLSGLLVAVGVLVMILGLLFMFI